MTIRTFSRIPLLFGATFVCTAQHLVVDSASTTPGGTVSVAIRLSGGANPAALQWSVSYAPADFAAVSLTAGSAAAAAGKTVACRPASGQLRCVAYGMNAAGIADGVVANVSLALSAHTAPRPLSLVAHGASPAGQPVNVSATGGIVTTILPELSTLSCAAAELRAGASTSCTAGLTSAALPGGATVALSTDSTLLQAPASVTVPAGQLTAQFSVSAGAVTMNQSAALTAVLGSVRSVAFTLSPPPPMCPCSLWSAEDRPVLISAADTAAVELGVKFRSSAPGYILGVRFYKGSQNTGTHSARIWTAAGQQLASVTFRNETPSGWQQADFATPVPVAANTTYVVSYRAPRGRYSADAYFFSAGPLTKGPLTALQSGTEGGNGVYRYGAVGFPNSTWNAANYWVDVVFNTAPSFTPAPAVAATSLMPEVSPFGMRGPETSQIPQPEFSVPDYETVAAGEPLRFLAAAAEREGAPNMVSAAEMPKGAHYDPVSGWFEWIPAKGQEGDARIVFRLKDREGRVKDVETKVRVTRSGEGVAGDAGEGCGADEEGEVEAGVRRCASQAGRAGP